MFPDLGAAQKLKAHGGPSGEIGLGEEPPFIPMGEPHTASPCPSPLPFLGPLPL